MSFRDSADNVTTDGGDSYTHQPVSSEDSVSAKGLALIEQAYKVNDQSIPEQRMKTVPYEKDLWQHVETAASTALNATKDNIDKVRRYKTSTLSDVLESTAQVIFEGV